MEEQDPSELAGGVEVGPVDPGSGVAAVGDEGVEGRVEGGEEGEVGRVLGVLVPRMDRGSGLLLPLPLLVLHRRRLPHLREKIPPPGSLRLQIAVADVLLRHESNEDFGTACK